jgi:hypothetical protein
VRGAGVGACEAELAMAARASGRVRQSWQWRRGVGGAGDERGGGVRASAQEARAARGAVTRGGQRMRGGEPHKGRATR